jgi:trehalose utilization protein
VRTKYDVVLFYNFHQEHTLPDRVAGRRWFGRTKGPLEELGETEQGIIVLHHAFNAFNQWEFWSKLVGIPHSDRACGLSEMGAGISFGDVRHMIADPAHPITQGMSTWEMYGELWDFGSNRLEPDCHTILLTDHPKMRLKSTAWTHQFREARVFCLQPGHDNGTYANPNFRTVLSRGIRWAAGRL